MATFIEIAVCSIQHPSRCYRHKGIEQLGTISLILFECLTTRLDCPMFQMKDGMIGETGVEGGKADVISV